MLLIAELMIISTSSEGSGQFSFMKVNKSHPVGHLEMVSVSLYLMAASSTRCFLLRGLKISALGLPCAFQIGERKPETIRCFSLV